MFTPNILSKEDGENNEIFCKYEWIKYCPYVEYIENVYDRLNENDKLRELQEAY